MARKTNAQISNFMDKHFRFKIYISSYNLDYDQPNITFSELEAIIKSDTKYWKQKNDENQLATQFVEKWTLLNTKFNKLKNFLKEQEEFDFQQTSNFINSYFSSNYSIGPEDVRIIQIDINSPISRDKKISNIISFIDFYLNSRAINYLSEAVQTYIELEKNKNYIGIYLSSTETYRNLPALFVLNQELPSLQIPIEDIQAQLIQPVSESVDFIAKETEEHFKQTAKLIDTNNTRVNELFIEHSNKIAEFENNINQWQIDEKTALNTLKETYEKKLQLEAPEKLWKERSKSYTIKTRYWMGGLAIFIVVLIYSAGSLLVSIHDYLQGTIKDIPFISQSFVYVALISFLIYLIRVVIKIIISSQHMAMEYEQKEALTRFYQALVYDGNDVDGQEKLIIFNALFSKTDTGLVKTDNTSESETLIALLSKNIGK